MEISEAPKARPNQPAIQTSSAAMRRGRYGRRGRCQGYFGGLSVKVCRRVKNIWGGWVGPFLAFVRPPDGTDHANVSDLVERELRLSATERPRGGPGVASYP